MVASRLVLARFCPRQSLGPSAKGIYRLAVQAMLPAAHGMNSVKSVHLLTTQNCTDLIEQCNAIR